MANTLQAYGESIARRLGRENDHAFLENAKDDFKSKFAQRMRQTIEKSGRIDEQFKISFPATLITVDKVDFCNITSGCKMLRTEYPVPSSVRYSTDSPFSYVGDINGMIYTHVKIHEQKIRKYYPVVSTMPTYMYRNKYVYLLRPASYELDSIILENIWIDIEDIMRLCGDNNCYTDDMIFPVPDDMAMSIVEEVVTFYAALKPRRNEE